MKTIPISQETLQKTLNYLATQPYAEVYLLIAEIQQAAEAAASPNGTSEKAVVHNPSPS